MQLRFFIPPKEFLSAGYAGHAGVKDWLSKNLNALWVSLHKDSISFKFQKSWPEKKNNNNFVIN